MVSNRAMKVLNFVKRNLTDCPINTKIQAYLTLVRSIMEYASPIWDPYYNSDIYKLEKVKGEPHAGYYPTTAKKPVLLRYYCHLTGSPSNNVDGHLD